MSGITENTTVRVGLVGAFVLAVWGAGSWAGRLEGRVTSDEQRTDRIAVAYTGHVAQSALDKEKAFELLKDISDRLARLEGHAGLTVPRGK